MDAFYRLEITVIAQSLFYYGLESLLLALSRHRGMAAQNFIDQGIWQLFSVFCVKKKAVKICITVIKSRK